MNFLKNILLVLVALFVLLLLGEIMIRMISPQNLSGSWRVESGTGYMLNKSHGSSKHQFGDRVVHYKFRPPHLRDMGISNGGYKVFVLGDSYTFGWLLDSKDTYISNMQKFADEELGVGKVQFINGGAGGWGTADYVRFTEEFGDVIAPDAIVVFFNTDDIGRSIKKNLYRLKDDTGLALEVVSRKRNDNMTKATINSLSGYQVLLENSHLLQFLRSAYLKLKYPKQTVARKIKTIKAPSSYELSVQQIHSERLGHALFIRLNEWGSRRNIPLIVATTNSFAFSNKEKKSPTMAFYSVAPEIFDKEGIQFIDISAGIESATGGNPDRIMIPYDGHPNEAGALLIAEQVWPRLKPFLHAAVSKATE